ncbi:MAG: hypothetical protein GXY83_00165 [Rhodopirellula sp.]|nr:hypothetical protein [Rhodopirellula sp.]
MTAFENLAEQGNSAPSRSSPLPPRRRAVVVLLAAFALPVVFLYGRPVLVWWTQMMASARVSDGAISAAEQWLGWAAWLDPADGTTELMRATCLRHLHQYERWSEAIQSAERQGAPEKEIQQETRLGSIEKGERLEGVEEELAAMTAAGISPTDLCEALVRGYLAIGDPRKVGVVLDAWEATLPGDPHRAYVHGDYWSWMGMREGELLRRAECFERARAEYERALAGQPRHEMARTALGDLLAEQDRLEEALGQYAVLVNLASGNGAAKLRVAATLRRLGRIEEARAVLESLYPQSDLRQRVAGEMGQIECELGNYREAQKWFKQLNVEAMEDAAVARGMAITLSLLDETGRAERFLDRLDGAHYHELRIGDLQARLAASPRDAELAEELRRVTAAGIDGDIAGDPGTEGGSRTSGADLYAAHCGACHGENGDGNGRAARHLFPKPQNLRSGRFRLPSTRNGVATLADIESVLLRGMPGTAMRSFENLSEDQRALLAREVQRIYREGVGEHLIKTLIDQGEEIDEDDVRQAMKICTTPGETVRVGPIGQADPPAIARGRASYFDLGCNHCHGDDGRGAADSPDPWDDQGRIARPRDLVNEPLKGGDEPESIYRRILLGMPGTPHPACWTVSEEKLIDLVCYCRSLSRQPKRPLSNYEQARYPSSGEYLSELRRQR